MMHISTSLYCLKTKINGSSVNTDLCPIEMDQNLVNNLWPNLEETIIYDVMQKRLMDHQAY